MEVPQAQGEREAGSVAGAQYVDGGVEGATGAEATQTTSRTEEEGSRDTKEVHEDEGRWQLVSL